MSDSPGIEKGLEDERAMARKVLLKLDIRILPPLALVSSMLLV